VAFELSPRAEIDLASILAFTEMVWGERQADEYSAIPERALATIGDDPYIGIARPDARQDLRSYQVRQHVIYFSVEDNSVRIDRILHFRMDATRALEP
jgi:toxin ParE1/3/4